MFIIVPLLLIIGSLSGIAIIVHRKLPHLKKLIPETNESGNGIVKDFFPELFAWICSMEFKSYKQLSLTEVEKFLRRLRVMSLKIDHMSDSMIKKIRKVQLTNHLEKAVIERPSPDVASAPAAPSQRDKSQHKGDIGTGPLDIGTDELKAREQKLIIDIAQNPKDSELYEELGDLYLKMNSAQDAKESYEAALELNPSDIALARKYSRLLKNTEVAA